MAYKHGFKLRWMTEEPGIALVGKMRILNLKSLGRPIPIKTHPTGGK
jgi:hypothetical protein